MQNDNLLHNSSNQSAKQIHDEIMQYDTVISTYRKYIVYVWMLIVGNLIGNEVSPHQSND